MIPLLMKTTRAGYAVTAAAAVALLVLPGRAAAQAVETDPQRAPESVLAPAGQAPALETGTIRPTGAAPVPEERGPLGEPAPPAVVPAAALTDSTEILATDEAPAVELGTIAADAGTVASESGTVATGTVDESSAPLGSELLGTPAPTPTRRSFLPAARTAARAEAVPVLGSGSGLVGDPFREDQLAHRRVADAQFRAKFDLKALFAERGLTYPPRDIYFRLFKQEQVLEVWVRDAPMAETYTLLREYPICAIPGRLGPKTRIDDFQAPEGFYYIEGFNPESDYHLSLRLNYPNPADQIIGVADSWGGDIYIHGGCSTVGCFPMTDEAMAELYWLAVEARAAGQAVIPVHVFPARMNDASMNFLRRTFERDERLVAFWENLREGYTWFETRRQLPAITVSPTGRYLFAASATPEQPSAGAPPAPGLLGEEVGTERPAAGAPAAVAPTPDSFVTDASATPIDAPATTDTQPTLPTGTLQGDGPLGSEMPAAAPANSAAAQLDPAMPIDEPPVTEPALVEPAPTEPAAPR